MPSLSGRSYTSACADLEIFFTVIDDQKKNEESLEFKKSDFFLIGRGKNMNMKRE